MKSGSKLDHQTLLNLLQIAAIDELPLSDIAELFRREINEARYHPVHVYQTDPRTGEHILYHTARSSRVHDNVPESNSERYLSDSCMVCDGETTGIVDAAQLSEGFTFINKNLFPVLFPFPQTADESKTDRQIARGLHFLQWTSSYHDRDWHNMPLDDASIVMRRLAILERKLVKESIDQIEGKRDTQLSAEGERYVLIFKNFGSLVGGSLAHGHQQIALSSLLPRRFKEDQRFEIDKGMVFSKFMLEQMTEDLLVRDYGPAVLLVPFFMRRPYDMMLLLKNTTKRHLYQLTESELRAVASGWSDATRAIHTIMPQIGKEVAFNIVTHNGPGAGLYFEFLPYTQEIGGFEQLGLIVCQADPKRSASRLRDLLDST